jgi:1A family penicillin-binding protein
MTLKDFLKSIYPAVYFIEHLPKKATRYPLIAMFWGTFFALVSFYTFILKDLPSPSSLSTVFVPLTTHIKDRSGNELYKIYRNQNRTLIKLADLPSYVPQSITAIEDKNFYSHRGFSPIGTLRAFINNFRSGSLQGGSTITQQLVKTSLLSPEKTLRRKIKELVLSLAVELIYTKNQILEMYLNRVNFGGATYGIEEAAQTYFGKSASALTLAEASLLAGLPASPTTYSPFGVHPETAKDRQKDVLRQMVSAGFISWDQAASVSATDLVFRHPQTDIQAPHFVMYIKDILARKYGLDMVESGGLEVTTSLDLPLQLETEKIVTSELDKIKRLNIGNGAVLITQPHTGEILAMVGSKNYFDLDNDGNVNVTLSPRQPGSSIKPLNYALAFQRGFTPASIIDDSPITYKVPGQPAYSPINYDHRYHGKVSLRTALASSFNIPAVKLLSANGIENLVTLATRMGITTWTDPSRFGLSLTLGGGEVRMIDLAVAYGVFANSGYRVDLNPILEVKDSQGKILETSAPHSASVLDPQIAFLISDILSDNVARSPTFGAFSQLHIPKTTVAVKTGTTNNLRDNWTIGYTPNFLVAAWVGNNDNSPMSYVASGVTGASPIWRKVTDYLLKLYPTTGFTPPPNLVKTTICSLTGQLACSACPVKTEYFISGTQPKVACDNDAIQKMLLPQPSPGPRDTILEGLWTIRHL